MAMIDMAREPEREEMPGQIEMDEPRYPEELCLTLESDDLKKLNITTMPAIGTVMEIRARVYVKAIESSQTQGGVEKEVELQVTHMGIEPAARQDQAATMLYGG
jgi:hypothetical protein